MRVFSAFSLIAIFVLTTVWASTADAQRFRSRGARSTVINIPRPSAEGQQERVGVSGQSEQQMVRSLKQIARRGNAQALTATLLAFINDNPGSVTLLTQTAMQALPGAAEFMMRSVMAAVGRSSSENALSIITDVMAGAVAASINAGSNNVQSMSETVKDVVAQIVGRVIETSRNNPGAAASLVRAITRGAAQGAASGAVNANAASNIMQAVTRGAVEGVLDAQVRLEMIVKSEQERLHKIVGDSIVVRDADL